MTHEIPESPPESAGYATNSRPLGPHPSEQHVQQLDRQLDRQLLLAGLLAELGLADLKRAVHELAERIDELDLALTRELADLRARLSGCAS